MPAVVVGGWVVGSENHVCLVVVETTDKCTTFVRIIDLISNDLGLYYMTKSLEILHNFILIPYFRYLSHKQSHIDLCSLQTGFL